MILGCADAMIYFPLNILPLVTFYEFTTQSGVNIFYPGWRLVHSDWTPISVPESIWKTLFWNVFNIRWNQWINVFYGVLFFLLFGVTTEARESYKRVFWAAANRFGYTRPVQARASNIVFQSAVPDTVNSEYVLVLAILLVH